jgi:hypothetical protein
MNTLTYSYLTMYAFLFNTPIWVEISLIHDMVKNITNPMARSDARTNYYYIFIFIMAGVSLAVYAYADF